MTGAYVRIQDESGEWVSVEFEHLTPDQLRRLKNQSYARGLQDAAAEGWKWSAFLARWIRENVRESRRERDTREGE